VIRRAIILRALLKRQKGIVDSNKKVHIDKDLLYAYSGEQLAREIHKHYLDNQQKKKVPKSTNHLSKQSLEKLSESKKESNRQQAYDFFVKLKHVRSFYQKKRMEIKILLNS
jgi:flagellar biosynthesis component FlhA